jgi:hypothetical protein
MGGRCTNQFGAQQIEIDFADSTIAGNAMSQRSKRCVAAKR